MFRYFLLFILGILPFLSHADIIKGRVVDAKTQEPIDGALIEIEGEIIGLCKFLTSTQSDSLGVFILNQGSDRLMAKFNMIGYKSQTKHYTLLEGNDTIHVGDIALEPSDIWLREATAKAKARRFTMSGDTVVFNPDAFLLKEGERLETLLMQLPGVSVREGQLYWQNRPVRLKMNGTEGMGNLLMGRLPVEAVQNVKAYEEKSELTDRTGKDDGEGEQVLDVTIKPSWLDKWYGDVKLRAYPQTYYEAESDAYRLSTNRPFNVYARVGDNDYVVNQKTFGSTSSSEGNAYKQQLIMLGYKHGTPSAHSKRENYWKLSSSLNHYDAPSEQLTHTTQFFDNASPVYTSIAMRNYNHQLQVPLAFNSQHHLDSLTTLTINADLSLTKTRSELSLDQNTYDQSPFEGVEVPWVNKSHLDGLTHTKTFDSKLFVALHRFITEGEIDLSATAKYKHADTEMFNQTDYAYSRTPFAGTDKQIARIPTDDYAAEAVASLKRWWTKALLFETAYKLRFTQSNLNDQRYRWDFPDLAPNSPQKRLTWLPETDGELEAARDAINSTWSRHREWSHHLTPRLTLTKGNTVLTGRVDLSSLHERMAFRRGQVDTVVYRNSFLPNPALAFKMKPTKQMSLRLESKYGRTLPSMLDVMAYTDDTNPTLVVQGNPDLKPSSYWNINTDWSWMIPRGSQLVNLSLEWTRHFDPIVTVTNYDTPSGCYRIHKENHRAGYTYGAALRYDRSLGPRLRFSNAVGIQQNLSYGWLPLVDGATVPTQTRGRLMEVTERPQLTYAHNDLKIELLGTWLYRRIENSASTPAVINLHTYSGRLSASYSLDKWEFEAVANYRGHRGFADTEMNRPQMLIDLSVGRKILRNKGKLELTLSDMFDKESNYEATLSPTAKTETWHSNFGRYLALTFTYHFDAKKGKK